MYRSYQRINVAVQSVGRNLALQSPPHLLNRVLSMPSICRQVQQLNSWVFAQPLHYGFGLVDSGVVQHQHQHQRLTRIRKHQFLHKGDELYRPLVLRHFVQPSTTLPLKRPKQRPLAVLSGRWHLNLLTCTSQHPHAAQHRHQMHIALIQAQNDCLFGCSEQRFTQMPHLPHLSPSRTVLGQRMAGSAPAVAKPPKYPPHRSGAHFQSEMASQVSTQRNHSPQSEQVAQLCGLGLGSHGLWVATVWRSCSWATTPALRGRPHLGRSCNPITPSASNRSIQARTEAWSHSKISAICCTE